MSFLTVAHAEDKTCSQRLFLEGQEGYIASIITEVFNYGSRDCPWFIQVEHGQSINITMLDFTFTENNDKRTLQSDIFCNVYAVIGGGSSREREAAICGGTKREQAVYISEGNSIEVKIVGYSNPERQIYFMLKYQGTSFLHKYKYFCVM